MGRRPDPLEDGSEGRRICRERCRCHARHLADPFDGRLEVPPSGGLQIHFVEEVKEVLGCFQGVLVLCNGIVSFLLALKGVIRCQMVTFGKAITE